MLPSLIHCLGEGLLRVVVVHDLVYYRASKNNSLLPPALVHSKVSVEEEGPIRVHEQWDVPVVLLWFPWLRNCVAMSLR